MVLSAALRKAARSAGSSPWLRRAIRSSASLDIETASGIVGELAISIELLQCVLKALAPPCAGPLFMAEPLIEASGRSPIEVGHCSEKPWKIIGRQLSHFRAK